MDEVLWAAVPAPTELTEKPANPAAAAWRMSCSMTPGSSWLTIFRGTSATRTPLNLGFGLQPLLSRVAGNGSGLAV